MKWTSPFDPNSDILGYGITYQIVESILPIETPRPPITVASQSIDTAYTLKSLLAGTTYGIVVFAVFEEGTGPISEEIIVQTPEKGSNSLFGKKANI